MMRSLRRVWYAVLYAFIFLRELSLANYQVAKLALTPGLRFRSGFVSIPLDARTDLEITAFANSITLTPGTISVHVSDDRRHIVIHAIDMGDDVEALRRATKAALEAPTLRFLR